jgi:mono/diheme cytochrome c family protein
MSGAVPRVLRHRITIAGGHVKSVLIAIGVSVALAAHSHPLAAQNAEPVSGESVYKEECKSCHGVNGVPPERERKKYKKLKTLGDSGFVVNLSQDSIVTILQKGIDKNMKSFKDKLSDPEMKAVAIYIKELAEKVKKEGS